jgi:hypothetical protein
MSNTREFLRVNDELAKAFFGADSKLTGMSLGNASRTGRLKTVKILGKLFTKAEWLSEWASSCPPGRQNQRLTAAAAKAVAREQSEAAAAVKRAEQAITDLVSA